MFLTVKSMEKKIYLWEQGTKKETIFSLLIFILIFIDFISKQFGSYPNNTNV